MEYILDRIEDGLYVFLQQGNERTELLIPVEHYSGKLTEGDAVRIAFRQDETVIEVLPEETERRKKRAEDLLKKLQHKNKR